MTSITIDGLSVAYGGNRVLDDLSLSIGDGEFFTLLGPSGCGKTTLLRTIAGFISPESGEIHFGDTAVTELPVYRREIGMVFQDYALFPDRTVNANVAYGLKARQTNRSDIAELVDEVLMRVGIAGLGDRMPAALSGGQRQRVALARALVIKPRVLLMDEPLSNLDKKLRVQVRESISDIQGELGITTVFVTHDQEEALALSDRMAVLRAGTIDQLGSPSDVYRNPVSTYTADFIGAANVLRVALPEGRRFVPGDPVDVRLGDSTLCGVARTELVGADVFAVARPEALRLSGASAAALTLGAAVRGEVTRHQFLGSRQVHRVRVPGGQEIEVSTAASEPGFGPGDRVCVEFPREDVLVMRS
ncbi:ABC transporter ATP-binding protein [Xylanimonas ulmi]|uniref:ABC-type quaternary amine transporter n=1 Tax=Xylanimonas ulmi TaxID=228973 RepID=A0A4Q7M0H2_9MICO|nr:ABC transporter ATP-binding protein [Xylanibacterium ulmi]RZS59828.1 iron(III) transport system ATP-binding protein [Xylanibacterium ulmi]